MASLRRVRRLPGAAARRHRPQPLRATATAAARVLWSVFVMSGATLGMALVPSYAQSGVTASALMVRAAPGPGLLPRGELPGALTYIVEPRQVRAFVSSVLFACVTIGVAVATASASRCDSPAAEYVPFSRWHRLLAWRPGGVLSFVLRRSLRNRRVRTDAQPGLARPLRELLPNACEARPPSAARLLHSHGLLDGLLSASVPRTFRSCSNTMSRQGVFFANGRRRRGVLGILVTGSLERPYPAAISTPSG